MTSVLNSIARPAFRHGTRPASASSRSHLDGTRKRRAVGPNGSSSACGCVIITLDDSARREWLKGGKAGNKAELVRATRRVFRVVGDVTPPRLRRSCTFARTFGARCVTLLNQFVQVITDGLFVAR